MSEVCQRRLHREGKPYPRTCPTCFLGKCKFYEEVEKAELDCLRAQLDEAREALEPFVDWCVTCEVCISELRDTVRVSAGITMGDLRRVRTVYEKIKGGGDE